MCIKDFYFIFLDKLIESIMKKEEHKYRTKTKRNPTPITTQAKTSFKKVPFLRQLINPSNFLVTQTKMAWCKHHHLSNSINKLCSMSKYFLIFTNMHCQASLLKLMKLCHINFPSCSSYYLLWPMLLAQV